MTNVRRGRVIALSVAFAVACILPGARDRVEAASGELRIGLTQDVSTWDPHNYLSAVDNYVYPLVYERLVHLDRDLKMVPGLASEWEAVGDRALRFKLRTGIRFHDGSPFDAQAVKTNFERLAAAPRARAYYGAVDRVEVNDPYTVTVFTKQPSATFLANLTWVVGGIISPTALQQYGKDIAQKPVGTGPYRLKEHVQRDRIVLESNPHYWGRPSRLARVTIRPIAEEATRTAALEGGNLDVIMDVSPHRIQELERNPNLRIAAGRSVRNVYLGFQIGDETLKNVKLRQAIAHAIDRDAILRHVLEGRQTTPVGIVPSIVLESRGDALLKYDPDRARGLLAEAGYSRGLDLAFWTPSGRYLKDREIAEALQAQLARIGVRVQIKVWEWAPYMAALRRREQQLFIFGFNYPSGDPDAGLRNLFHSKGGFPFFNVNDRHVDELLDKGQGLVGVPRAERMKLYEEVQRLLLSSAIAVPMYEKRNLFGTSAKVKGFAPHPLEYLDLTGVSVE